MRSVVDRNVVMRRMTVNSHQGAELLQAAFHVHQFVAPHTCHCACSCSSFSPLSGEQLTIRACVTFVCCNQTISHRRHVCVCAQTTFSVYCLSVTIITNITKPSHGLHLVIFTFYKNIAVNERCIIPRSLAVRNVFPPPSPVDTDSSNYCSAVLRESCSGKWSGSTALREKLLAVSEVELQSA